MAAILRINLTVLHLLKSETALMATMSNYKQLKG